MSVLFPSLFANLDVDVFEYAQAIFSFKLFSQFQI